MAGTGPVREGGRNIRHRNEYLRLAVDQSHPRRRAGEMTLRFDHSVIPSAV